MRPAPPRLGLTVALVLAVILPLAACGQSSYTWGWYVVWPGTAQGQRNIYFLLTGLGNTIAVSTTAIAASVSIGLVVGLLGIAKHRGARAFNRGYVEIVRAIPILVLILWVYYGMPVLFESVGLNVNFDVFAAGVVALAFSDSAFQAEIFRAGIQSIDRGQHEASDSLGLTYFDKMRYVILPQAVRRILPPLGNQFVYMLKMSSLVSVIGMTELTRRANELVVAEYRPLEIYTFLVLEYLALILVVSFLVRRLERRMSTSDGRAR